MELDYTDAGINSILDIPDRGKDHLVKHLIIHGNNLVSLEGITRYPNLVTLSCANNQLTSLRGLEACPKLRLLICKNNKLPSLEGLEQASELATLYCNNNPLTTLKGIKRKPSYIYYNTDHFPKEYNPEKHLELINFSYGLSLVHKNYYPIRDKSIRKFQRLYRK